MTKDFDVSLYMDVYSSLLTIVEKRKLPFNKDSVKTLTDVLGNIVSVLFCITGNNMDDHIEYIKKIHDQNDKESIYKKYKDFFDKNSYENLEKTVGEEDLKSLDDLLYKENTLSTKDKEYYDLSVDIFESVYNKCIDVLKEKI